MVRGSLGVDRHEQTETVQLAVSVAEETCRAGRATGDGTLLGIREASRSHVCNAGNLECKLLQNQDLDLDLRLANSKRITYVGFASPKRLFGGHETKRLGKSPTLALNCKNASSDDWAVVDRR